MKIILLVGILFSIFFNGICGIAEEPIRKVDGWGGYKFGISMNQATAVRKDAKWEEIEYSSEKEKCLVFDTTVHGEKGKVVVRFENGKLFRIHINFDRFKGGCDEKLTKTVSEGLISLYGTKYAKSENRKIVWRFPQGGLIELTNFCIMEQDTDFKRDAIGTGIVFVIYEYSEGF